MATETITPAAIAAGTPIDLRQAVLPVGMMVRVRNRFEGRWVPGFSVAAHHDGRYRLRRASDGAVLPAWFDRDALRSDEA
jgi:hypothetical protein